MQKKAQITIFIILGITIVIAVGLFAYYKLSIQPELNVLEEGVSPVHDFVDFCIESTAKEGLNILGLNGGFITFPEKISANPFSYLSTSPIPEQKNPYWWFNGINNTPTLESMRSPLSEYVTTELKNCLNDFKEIKEDFEIKELGNIITVTKINENDVSFEITYPILITNLKNETKFKLSKFNVVIPIRLKVMYELATSIIGSQLREAFIEKKVMDIISLDTDNIPTTDIEATCKKKVWEIERIRNRLKELLGINLPYIRVANTKYEKDLFVPTPYGPEKYENSYYNYHYIWYATNKMYPDTHVGFTYDPKWQLELQASPSDGRYLKSNGQKGTELLSAICLHIWHFTYDISFPVKVTIYDEKTSKNNEYSFIFAFKTSINHNKPDRISLASPSFSIPSTLNSEEFCSETSNEIVINTEDLKANEPIGDVELKLICGLFECDLGKSEIDFNSGGSVANIRKNMPSCVAGFVSAKKESYIDTEIPVQTDQDRTYTISLMPLKNIPRYKVVKHNYDGKIVGAEKVLSSDERVSLTLNNKENNYEAFSIYPGEDFPINLLAKDDYKYDLSLYLLKGTDVVGGYIGEWDVNWEQLRNANEIIFHVLVQEPLPKDETERFLFIGGLKEYSKNVIQPELK